MIEYKDIYGYLDQIARCDEIPTLAGWVHWRRYARVVGLGGTWQLDPSIIAVEVTVTVPGGVGLNVTSLQAGGVVKTVPQYVENTYYASDVWAVFPAPHIVGGISVLPAPSSRPVGGEPATWIVNLEDAPLAAGWGAKAYLHDPIIHSKGEWVTFDRTAVKVKMMSRNAQDSDAIAICERAWRSSKTGVSIQTAILEAAAFNGVQLANVPKGLPVPSITPSGGNASTGASGGTYTMTTPAGTGTYTFGGKPVGPVIPQGPILTVLDEDAVDDGQAVSATKNRKQVMLRMDEELRERLAALAKARGQSVNFTVSELIRKEVDAPRDIEDQFIVSWQLLPDEDTEEKQNQIKKGIVDLISAYGGKGVWIRNRWLPGPATHGPPGGLPMQTIPAGTFWLQLHFGPFGPLGYDHIIGVERIECLVEGPAVAGGMQLVPVSGWSAFPYTTTVTHWTLWSDAKDGQFLFGDKFASSNYLTTGQDFEVVNINVSLSNLAP